MRVAAAGALLSALAGCGGDDPQPPLVVVTPQPARGVIAQTSFSGFQSDVWISMELALSQRGVLDITVDWTYSDTWMSVFFGRSNCDYARLAGRTCPFILSSETKSPKPRVLYTEALDPGTYYLVLYNVPRDPRTGTGSDNTESVSLQLGLTVSATGQRSTDAIHLGRPIVVSPPRL
ncbi:MAG TPA: hypothetical protein VLF95_04205 [Vicinamibacteria bacterium]|nr:hypothetical protein [Vicinamibacteria bacterium]